MRNLLVNTSNQKLHKPKELIFFLSFKTGGKVLKYQKINSVPASVLIPLQNHYLEARKLAKSSLNIWFKYIRDLKIEKNILKLYILLHFFIFTPTLYFSL